jgi:hypothetical protein
MMMALTLTLGSCGPDKAHDNYTATLDWFADREAAVAEGLANGEAEVKVAYENSRDELAKFDADMKQGFEDTRDDLARIDQAVSKDLAEGERETTNYLAGKEKVVHDYTAEKLTIIRDGDSSNNRQLASDSEVADADLQRQIDELELKLIEEIVNNTTNLEDAMDAMSEHFNVELLNIELTPGPQGEKGDQGIQGNKGAKGAAGLKGADGEDGEDGQFGSVITLCPNVSGQFKEVLFSIGGKLYAVLKSGNNVALIEVGNGNWKTTDGRTCNFTVSNGIITAQTGG